MLGDSYWFVMELIFEIYSEIRRLYNNIFEDIFLLGFFLVWGWKGVCFVGIVFFWEND